MSDLSGGSPSGCIDLRVPSYLASRPLDLAPLPTTPGQNLNVMSPRDFKSLETLDFLSQEVSSPLEKRYSIALHTPARLQ